MKTPIGRPRKGEPRSRSVTCDACGTPFTRKMSQADRSVGSDNPPCVNPTHLRVGSWGENIRDMIAKGRNQDRKGARHPLARLTEADVLCIRALAGVRTQAAVAAEYGVCRAQMHRIQARKNWGHVHGG